MGIPVLDFIGGLLGQHAQRNAQKDQATLTADQQALDAQKFNATAPMRRISGAALGDLMAGVQPAAFSGGGRDLNVTGGLSPALLSQGSRQLGANVSRQALLSQLNATGQGPAAPAASPLVLPAGMPTNDWIRKITHQPTPEELAAQQNAADPYSYHPTPFKPR